jgi:hypothetical protein
MRQNLPRGLGFLVLGLALLANPWLLGLVISPDRRIDTTSVRVVILIGQALLLILGFVLLSNHYRTTSAELALMGGSVILALAGGIILLQIFYPLTPIRSGWRSRTNRLEKNELGFRGHSIHYDPDDFVIVLLGDSNVQANACAYDWMPERRLEEHLNRTGRAVKVFTVGANGYGQDQELMAIDEYLGRYRADLVLLWLYPRNDIWNNIFPTSGANAHPKPTFWLEGDSLRGPSEAFEELIWSHRFKVLALLQRLWLPRRRDADWMRRLPPAYHSMAEYEGKVDHWMMEKLEQGLLPLEDLATEKSHFSLSLVPRSPRTEYGIHLTRHLLHRIQDSVVGHQGKLVLFSQRANEESGWPLLDGVYDFRGRYYRMSQDQLNASIRELVEGFPFFATPIEVQPSWVGPTDPHLNEHAVDAFMKSLAEEILPYVLTHHPDVSHSPEDPSPARCAPSRG